MTKKSNLAVTRKQEIPQSIDGHIETAQALLALVRGTLKKDSSLKLSFQEMLGVEIAVNTAYEELTKAAELLEGD